MLTCALLAGVFLTHDARRSGDEQLARTPRTRTIAVGVLTGAVVLAALVPIHDDATTLSHQLTRRAAVLFVASAVCGVTTITLLSKSRYFLARSTAVGAVGAVIVGWGVAPYPWLLSDTFYHPGRGRSAEHTHRSARRRRAGAVIVVPALIYLIRLTQTEAWTHPATSSDPQQASEGGLSPLP